MEKSLICDPEWCPAAIRICATQNAYAEALTPRMMELKMGSVGGHEVTRMSDREEEEARDV